MGLFGKRKPKKKHDPDEVAVLMDITGYCGKCRRKGNARLVAYYSGEVIIRCNNCKTAGLFKPDDSHINDPKYFAPFLDDSDDEPDEKDGEVGKHPRDRH